MVHTSCVRDLLYQNGRESADRICLRRLYRWGDTWQGTYPLIFSIFCTIGTVTGGNISRLESLDQTDSAIMAERVPFRDETISLWFIVGFSGREELSRGTRGKDPKTAWVQGAISRLHPDESRLNPLCRFRRKEGRRNA